MRSTPEQIEEMLKPYGLTLSELPKPNALRFAYERKDMETATKLAEDWEGKQSWREDSMSDFICHQCDVIELLMTALSIANKRIETEQNSCGAQLYLRDNTTGRVRKYGGDQHDSLILKDDGSISYYNLQNGEGTGCPGSGYSFCLADGTIPPEDEYDERYLDIGGRITGG